MVQEEHQLGDFIKGRLQFIQEYSEGNGLDPKKMLDRIHEESLTLAGTKERADFLEKRFFRGAVLATSYLPDWVDKVLLEAMTHVLKGPDAPLFTSSSRDSCIPFEAGRFNARRQARSVFRLLYAGKTPDHWIGSTFRVLYQKCYGEEAARDLKIEPIMDGHYRISVDHHHLEKATPVDCSTIVGYLYGSLEELGAKRIQVDHTACATRPGSAKRACVFEVTWA